jgi:hypothetical protein
VEFNGTSMPPNPTVNRIARSRDRSAEELTG